MRTVAAVALCLGGASAMRQRQRRKAGWTTLTDKTHGVCAENMQYTKDEPVEFPLMCAGDASNVKLAATAWGLNSKLWIKVDGEEAGERRWPLFGGTRTFEVPLPSLAKGLHRIHVRTSGSFDFKNFTVSGGGSACSLEQASSYTRELQSYTLNGLDVLNRMFGESRSFDKFKKQQLNFASETMGINEDGSINSRVVGEGFWEWFYQYSQQDVPHDKWGSNPDGLWDEAKMLPRTQIGLGFMPRHAGQNMTVYEPCNTLSNLAFHEAAIWVACKGWPFDRDEIASIMASFNGLAAGSAFLHACACKTGGRADTFTMDWLMLQSYQSLVREVVKNAGDRLTPEEQNAIMYFGRPKIVATELAKNMTRLFESKYNHEDWNRTIQSVVIPAYEMPIAGVISFVLWGLQGKFPIPGLGSLLQLVLDSLIDIFDIPDGEFFTQLYMPAVRKALGFSNICLSSALPVMKHTLSFIVTFVEALVFQEKMIPTPGWFRDALGFLDSLGVTSDSLNVMHVTWDYYNGFDCRGRSDHATWHEKAANGLIHFLEVAEEYRISSSYC